MRPAEIIERATKDGLTLSLSNDDKIRIAGDQRVIDEWLPIIQQHKTSMVSAYCELTSLVRFCGEAYGCTEEERAEALAKALADYDSALICFRSIKLEILAEAREAR